MLLKNSFRQALQFNQEIFNTISLNVNLTFVPYNPVFPVALSMLWKMMHYLETSLNDELGHVGEDVGVGEVNHHIAPVPHLRG
jgi:hypothetical protein